MFRKVFICKDVQNNPCAFPSIGEKADSEFYSLTKFYPAVLYMQIYRTYAGLHKIILLLFLLSKIIGQNCIVNCVICF